MAVVPHSPDRHRDHSAGPPVADAPDAPDAPDAEARPGAACSQADEVGQDGLVEADSLEEAHLLHFHAIPEEEKTSTPQRAGGAPKLRLGTFRPPSRAASCGDAVPSGSVGAAGRRRPPLLHSSKHDRKP